MSGLIRDIRFGFRQLLKRPVWTISIILVLALGAGANTTMFSGFEAWVLRPLDFPEPDRLVSLNESRPKLGQLSISVSPRNLGDWMEQQQSFEGFGIFRRHQFNFNDDYQPVRLGGARISASLFPVLDKPPILGRGFTDADDRPGQPSAVALISDHLWRTRFDGDRNVIGKTVRLDGRPHEIVGVMEPGFKFPEWAEVWTPLGLDVTSGERGSHWASVVARLRPDASLEDARHDMEGIARRLEQLYPETNTDYGVHVLTLHEEYVPPVIRIALTMCLGASLFVLLIIAANVASLMLAQASGRARETAVRTALGASRWRLVRQSMVEGALLGLPAGALGILVGILGNEEMLAYVPVDPPYLFNMDIDTSVGVYTLLVALLAGVVCGLAPVIRNSGLHISETLKSGGERNIGAGSGKRMRSILVTGQLALSTALLIGALLMAKSYFELQSVERGYRTDGILTAELSLSGEGLDEVEQKLAAVERLVDRLTGIPQVEGVGVSSQLPTSRSNRVWGLMAQGRPYEPGEEIDATVHAIAGEYLETLQIPVVAGRAFNRGEIRQGGQVAIVSQGLAKELWDEEGVVGRRLRVARATGEDWYTVVGVVGDVDYGRDMVNTGDLPKVQFYLPYGAYPTSTVAVVVQSASSPDVLAPAMRDGFRASTPGVPFSEILTMDDAIFRVRWVSAMFGRQLAMYAILATIIAALGLYGLTADSVSRRTRELAIRSALGADRLALIRLIIRDSLVLGGAGISLGILLAFGVTRFGSQMLVMVSAHDPVIFAAVTVLLLAVTLLATFLPARKASLLDTNSALRTE